MVCVSKFGEYFSDFIPNEVMSEDDFTLLFACKLNDYLHDYLDHYKILMQ